VPAQVEAPAGVTVLDLNDVEAVYRFAVEITR
jgi:hypothetical protein